MATGHYASVVHLPNGRYTIRQADFAEKDQTYMLYKLTQDQSNYKMASVIGILVFIVCAIITLVAFTRMTRGDKEATFQ